MKTNIFYNPRNQFGELLASQSELADAKNELNDAIKAEADELNKNDKEIRESLATTEDKLNIKIENLNTIKVKWINAERGDNKFSEIDDYFKSRLENATEEEIAELKIELGQTIYIIEGTDDASTYEEWVCRYPNVEINSTSLPEMIRLGAVDSILARVDSAGSVKLVHNLYDEEDWSKYFTTDYEGNVTHKPIKGQAVAPCALKAFVDRDNEIGSELTQEIKDREAGDNSIRKDVNAALEQLTSDYIAGDKALGARLTSLEIEVGGSTVGDEVDKHDSRLDLIEAAIGMNHHNCANCGCDHSQCSTHDSCSDATNKCTIYCRLNDAEGDLHEHMNTLEEHGERIEGLEETTSKHTDDIGNLQTEVSRLDTLINGNVERIDGRIANAESKIAENKEYILSVEKCLEKEENRSKATDATLREYINDEVEIRKELSSHVHQVLDTVIGEHSTSINNNTNTIAAHDTRITTAETKIGDIQESLNDTKLEASKNYSYFIKENSELNTAIGTNTSAIAAINNDITNRVDAALASLETADVAIRAIIGDLENKVDAVDNDLGEKLSTVQGELNKAVIDINVNKANLTTLTSRISIAESTISDNVSRITNLEGLTTNNSIAISGLKTDLSAAELTIKDNSERVDTLEEKVATAESNIAKNSEDITRYSSDIGVFGTRIDSLEERVDILETNSATKAELGDIDLIVKENSDSISEIKTEISKEVASLTGRITDLNTSLDGVIGNIQTDLNNTNIKVEDLEDNLADLTKDFEKVIDGQSQFIISTTLPASGSKEIKISNLFADEESESSEWSIFSVNSVAIANDNGWEVIYPEIEYLGSDETENNGTDNRLIKITFESGNAETLRIAVSAFKKINARIKTID